MDSPPFLPYRTMELPAASAMIGPAVDLRGGVRVGLHDPLVGLEELGHLATIRQGPEAIGDVAVGVPVLLELVQVGKHLRLAAVADADEHGAHPLALLVAGDGEGEPQAALPLGDGADLVAGLILVDHLRLLAGLLAEQGAGEVLRVVDRAVVGDGEAQRGDQPIDQRPDLGLCARFIGEGRRTESAAGQRDGGQCGHQLCAFHRSSTWFVAVVTSQRLPVPTSQPHEEGVPEYRDTIPRLADRWSCCRSRTPPESGRQPRWPEARPRAPGRGPARGPRAQRTSAAAAARARRGPATR